MATVASAIPVAVAVAMAAAVAGELAAAAVGAGRRGLWRRRRRCALQTSAQLWTLRHCSRHAALLPYYLATLLPYYLPCYHTTLLCHRRLGFTYYGSAYYRTTLQALGLYPGIGPSVAEETREYQPPEASLGGLAVRP